MKKLALVCVVWLLALLADRLSADEGVFVTVRPLSSEETKRILLEINEARRLVKPGQTLKLVFDFNPEQVVNASQEFGICYDLAKQLLKLRAEGVRTIAFVTGPVSQHSLLLVFACQDLVLSKAGSLGQLDPLDKTERLAYEEVLERRDLPSPDVARRLFDRTLRVRKIREVDKPFEFYVDSRKLFALPERDPKLMHWEVAGRKRHVFVLDQSAEDPLAGKESLPAESVLAFGLCNRLLESRDELAKAYQLPPESVLGDGLRGQLPRAWRLEIRGEVTPRLQQSVQRRVRRAVGRGANLLLLRFENCAGGRLETARDLAEFLRTLKDDSEARRPITTVAYVPKNAPDFAFVLALGCKTIIVDTGASLGDFTTLLRDEPERNQVTLLTLQDLAEKQGYPPAVMQGLLDPQVALWRVEKIKEPGLWKIMTEAEYLAQAADWRKVVEVKQPGTVLHLDADRALQLGIARHVLTNDNQQPWEPIYTHFGLKAADVQEARHDWLDGIAEVLRYRSVAALLVMVGIIGLLLELKLPGTTFPGIVSAVCFVLFFWSQSHLSGQFVWLALLLFVLGLLLLGLEIFVIPGFGVTGVSGIVLVLISFTLVTLEWKPETSQEWLRFGTTMTTFALGMVGAVIAALVLAAYLPNLPFVNRLVLKPAGENSLEDDAELENEALSPEVVSLLGAIGVAATPLRPAGKVQFGEKFVDVVADGGYVPTGTRVQVVEIEGNRIVVKEV